MSQQATTDDDGRPTVDTRHDADGADPADALVSLPHWQAEVPTLAERYARADPFPHIVLEDVLAPEIFAAALGEFPAVDSPGWLDYRHVNEFKWGNTHPETWGPTLQATARALMSPPFVEFLEQLTGITALLPDRSMDGGGLHQTLPGGHLNVHADFTAHHSIPSWRRRVNVLLYLNERWDESWGGELELWSRDMDRKVVTVAPTANRMLVFSTDETSFHGHPDALRSPAGTARQSLALYYFTRDEHVVARSTNYRPRPGDGPRAALVHLDRLALRGYDVLKRRLGWSDERLRPLRRTRRDAADE